jgi:hypothetical protein
MMAEKLQQGLNSSLQERLKDWIKIGPMGEKDSPLLKRLEKLFC